MRPRVRHPTATVYSLLLHCSRAASHRPSREFSACQKISGQDVSEVNRATVLPLAFGDPRLCPRPRPGRAFGIETPTPLPCASRGWTGPRCPLLLRRVFVLTVSLT